MTRPHRAAHRPRLGLPAGPLAGLLAAATVLGACTTEGAVVDAESVPPSTVAPSSAATPPPASVGVPPSTTPNPSPPPASTETTPAAAAALGQKPWATRPLVDARTGETFAIADLAGRVVFVEPMAIWCSICRRQQRDAVEAMARLDPDRVVWLALDVDPSESTADLRRYAEDNAFPHRYAVATPDVARALATEFGDQVVNPPSVPIVRIAADGSTEVSFGHLEPEAIVAAALASGA